MHTALSIPTDSLDDYNTDAREYKYNSKYNPPSSKHLEVKQSLDLAQANKEIIPSDTECDPEPSVCGIMICVPWSLYI